MALGHQPGQAPEQGRAQDQVADRPGPLVGGGPHGHGDRLRMQEGGRVEPRPGGKVGDLPPPGQRGRRRPPPRQPLHADEDREGQQPGQCPRRPARGRQQQHGQGQEQQRRPAAPGGHLAHCGSVQGFAYHTQGTANRGGQ